MLTYGGRLCQGISEPKRKLIEKAWELMGGFSKDVGTENMVPVGVGQCLVVDQRHSQGGTGNPGKGGNEVLKNA